MGLTRGNEELRRRKAPSLGSFFVVGRNAPVFGGKRRSTSEGFLSDPPPPQPAPAPEGGGEGTVPFLPSDPAAESTRAENVAFGPPPETEGGLRPTVRHVPTPLSTPWPQLDGSARPAEKQTQRTRSSGRGYGPLPHMFYKHKMAAPAQAHCHHL